MRRCGAVLAGTSFPNTDGSLRSQLIRRHCKNGALIYLRRELDNQDNINAVAVFLEVPRLFGFFGKTLRQIGYIKTDEIKDLTRRMKAGENIRGRVSSFNVPEGGGYPRVNIDIEYGQ